MGHTQWSGSPSHLWCYLGEWVARIRALTAGENPVLKGHTPIERMEIGTPDISEYAQFDWYQYVWLWDAKERFPNDRRKLA